MAEESKGAEKATIARDILQEIPAYKDTLQPALQEFGRELVPAGVNAARALVALSEIVDLGTSTVRFGVGSTKQFGQFVVSSLKARFQNKPEKLIPPSMNVAVPAIEAMRTAADEPSLRDMYLKLLETSMDSDTAEDAHPAFVHIIKQLTGDEARILEELRKYESFVICNVSAHFPGERRRDYRVILEAGAILTPTSTYKKFMMIPTCLENLERLQLTTSWPTGSNGATPHLGRTYPRHYPELERIMAETKETVVYNWVRAVNNVLQNNECVLYGLTPFGRTFCQACVESTL